MFTHTRTLFTHTSYFANAQIAQFSIKCFKADMQIIRCKNFPLNVDGTSLIC